MRALFNINVYKEGTPAKSGRRLSPSSYIQPSYILLINLRVDVTGLRVCIAIDYLLNERQDLLS